MQLSEAEQQIILAFHSTYTQADKTKREAAILQIKSLEESENFLPNMFQVIANYSHLHPPMEIIKSIINWIDKYVTQQYNPQYDAVKKLSRFNLMKVMIQGVDSLLKTKNIPHDIMILLSKPLVMMLNHQSNSTLKLELINTFPKLAHQNPGLLFFELYSILANKQSETILNRIIPNLDNLILNITRAEQRQILFYFQVTYLLLKQISSFMSVLLFNKIVGNKQFLQILLRAVQSGDSEVSKNPLNILILLTDQKDLFEVKDTPFLNEVNITLFPIVYQYLIEVQTSLSDRQYREQNQSFIIVLIRYFTSLLKLAKDEEQFHSKKVEIVLNIIFPLLLIPNQEGSNMIKQSPQKYLKIKEDMASDYKIQLIGSAAAKLLEIYSDKVDGVATLATQISFEIIRNTISQKQNPISKQYAKTTFFTITNANQRIQVSLCVLCILSYRIQQRPEVITEIEDIIEKYLVVLFDPWKTEISVGFIIFFQFYIDNLFKDESKQYLRSFVFDGVMTAVSIHPSRALLLAIYDFIENVMEAGDYNMVIRSKIVKTVDAILENILVYEDVDSLHIFKKLLHSEASNIVANSPSQFQMWISKLTDKIKYFIEERECNQFIIKGLDVLDSLMMNDQYEQYLDLIYNSVSHYLLVFNSSDYFIFDEILTVVNRYIQMKQMVPPSLNILLQNIESILEKNQSHIFNIFRTICLILVHSKQQSQIQRVYGLGLFTLKQTTTKLRSILNPLEGTLLVHLTIYHHIDKFSYENLQILLAETLNILNYQYIKHHKVMYGKYVLIILQCLRFRFEETTQIIKSRGEDVYQNFYKTVFQTSIYYDGYDRKVLIPSLVCMIYHKDFQSRFAYPAMKTLIYVLFDQYSALNIESAEEYVQSSDSQTEDVNKQLVLSQNSKEIFRLYCNPYAKIDEYSIFRELVQKVKLFKQSSSILDQVIDDLPIGIKKFLTDYAIRIQKVEGEKRVQNRKIFKVKRKQPGQ